MRALCHRRRVPPRPLPSALPAFFRTSAALAAGVSPSRLRASDLERPFHGVTARRASEATPNAVESHLLSASQYAVRMRESEFFSHVTAALLWGLPLPASALRSGNIDVSVHHPDRASRARGVRGHQMRSTLVSVVTHPLTGVMVTSPASTWASLATVLPNTYDLIAVGDAVVRSPVLRDHRPALATLDQLRHATAAAGRTGIDRLRESFPRVRTSAWSRTESWTRLLRVDSGLDEPVCNFELPAGNGRRRYIDLAYPQWKIAIEYEGLQHLLDRRQWDSDIARYERLVAEGWLVIRVTSEQLFTAPGSVITRVQAAIRARSAGTR